MARATHGGTAEQSDTAYQAVGSVSAFGVHPDLHSASLAPSFQHHSNDDGTGQQIQTPQQWRLGQWQRLHLEIEEFAKCSAPSSRDLRAVEAAVESVRREAAALWPESRTYLFGSQASGLSLPSSDLDIVILNASTSVLSAAHGFSSEAKLQVTARLKKLLKRLRTANVITAGLVIGRARIPIIKASTKQGNYSLDISMGTTNGAAAVCLLRHQVQAVPPLRPLALVIRALLKVHGLNEVYTGGLSSYSITWAILAHLQQEGFQIANPSASAGILPLKTLPSYHMMPAVSYNAQLDLGALLHGFLCRYGLHFNSNEEAVSVLHGGFMQKPASWRNDQKPWLLAVEDPQDPGRDIAAGSFEISRVFRAFADAATNLAAANDSMNDIMQVPHMALDLQRFPILSCILHMDLALSPSQPPQVARRPAQFAMHVPHKRSHSQYTAGNDHKSSAQQENTHFQQQRKPKRAKMALSPKKQNRADKQARQEYSNRGKHARGGQEAARADSQMQIPGYSTAQVQHITGELAAKRGSQQRLQQLTGAVQKFQAASVLRERDAAFGDGVLPAAPAYHSVTAPAAVATTHSTPEQRKRSANFKGSAGRGKPFKSAETKRQSTGKRAPRARGGRRAAS